MTQETKLFVGILGVTVAIIAGATAVLSQPAKPLSRTDLVANDSPSRGNVNAKTWLVEFSDFQCPACREFSNTVDALAAKYPESLQVVYRYYPLPQHPYADDAARAAEAANRQGKFWEMGTLMFAGQDTLSDTTVASMAASLGLDMKRFDADRVSTSVAQKVNEDVAYGDRIGISATPTFYLDGRKLELNSVDDLKKAVDAAVAEAK